MPLQKLLIQQNKWIDEVREEGNKGGKEGGENNQRKEGREKRKEVNVWG